MDDQRRSGRPQKTDMEKVNKVTMECHRRGSRVDEKYRFQEIDKECLESGRKEALLCQQSNGYVVRQELCGKMDGRQILNEKE